MCEFNAVQVLVFNGVHVRVEFLHAFSADYVCRFNGVIFKLHGDAEERCTHVSQVFKSFFLKCSHAGPSAYIFFNKFALNEELELSDGLNLHFDKRLLGVEVNKDGKPLESGETLHQLHFLPV